VDATGPYSMGFNIAQFSIGSIMVADLNNPVINSTGLAPSPGYHLGFDTPRSLFYLYLIFALTVGIQLLLLLITSFLANNVVLIDDSSLSIARLLREIVGRLGPAGTAATGEEISEQLKDMKVIYGIQRFGIHDTRFRVELGTGDRERAFPDGTYD